ncbi:hypothetical protein HYFRA_00013114 [Hymenoscyphus fraxineus]|uniref:Uncharacterized protein n=1 Tax=Hymenoscyphus fraxineus TaxID=746836 RepID=A0A9N9L778_9HELO|nr:hypothetical protein HYFRA_00013114 [Hymenoscyphus fraxineus]
MTYYQTSHPHIPSYISEVNSSASGGYPRSRDGSTYSDDLATLDDIPMPQGPPMYSSDIKNASLQEVPIEEHPYWNSHNDTHSIPLSRIPPPQPPIMGAQTTGTTMSPLPPPTYKAPTGAEVDWFRPGKNYRRPLIFVSAFSVFLFLLVLGLGITLGVEEKKLEHLRQTPIMIVTKTITASSDSTITNTITEPPQTVTSVATEQITATMTSTIITCQDKKTEPLNTSVPDVANILQRM